MSKKPPAPPVSLAPLSGFMGAFQLTGAPAVFCCSFDPSREEWHDLLSVLLTGGSEFRESPDCGAFDAVHWFAMFCMDAGYTTSDPNAVAEVSWINGRKRFMSDDGPTAIHALLDATLTFGPAPWNCPIKLIAAELFDQSGRPFLAWRARMRPAPGGSGDNLEAPR